MAYDLFLTNNGDISFYTSDRRTTNEIFEYNFHVAPTNSLLFNFSVENLNSNRIYPNQLLFNFYTYIPKYNKVVRTINEDNYIQQAIKIRLDTELGSIRGYEDMGANLHTILHSNMKNSRLTKNISEMVKAAISDILPNCSVNVSILNTQYLNYHNSIKIVIINNEKTYYYTL